MIRYPYKFILFFMFSYMTSYYSSVFGYEVNGANKPFTKDGWQEILNQYSKLESNFNQFLTPSNSCQLTNDISIDNKCKFKNFCDQLDNEKEYLYTNSEGGKIPNYTRMRLAEMVSKCFATAKAIHASSAPANETSLNELASFMSKERKEYLEVVKKSKWQAEYVEFEIAAEEIIQENVQKKEAQSDYFSLSREEVEKIVELIEKRAKVKMPNKVKEKYILTLLADRNVSQTSNPSQSQESGGFIKNPFFNGDLLSQQVLTAGSGHSLQKNNAKVSDAIKKTEALFLEVKNNILSLIDKLEKKNPSLKSQYDNMRLRIQTISYTTPPVGMAMKSSACASGPNAFYNPQQHSFTLCPQLLELPEMSLKQIMAHELGHSIDPCTLSMKLIKQQHPYGDHYYVDHTDTEIKMTDHRSIFALPINLKQNPSAEIISCLGSPESLNARLAARDISLKQLEETIEHFEKEGATKENNSYYATLLSTRSQFNDFFNAHGACGHLPGNSQIQEAWSDWVSAEVVGQELAKIPSPAERKKKSFESLSFLVATSCNFSKTSFELEAEKFLKNMGCLQSKTSSNIGQEEISKVLDQINYRDSDSHNQSTDRVEKLMLLQPNIRQALGCEDNKQGIVYCE